MARHLETTEVEVQLEMEGEAIRLSITDNGRGLPTDCPPSGHLGLANTRQRAELLGADLEIDSEPGQSTDVRLTVPFDPAS